MENLSKENGSLMFTSCTSQTINENDEKNFQKKNQKLSKLAKNPSSIYQSSIFNIEEVNEFEGSGHFMDQPCIGDSFNLKATISLFLSLILMISWYLFRHWLLSNIVAI